MSKVNYSAYKLVEKVRWTTDYMKDLTLDVLKIGKLSIADARSGIILEGLDLGTGDAHINLTLNDGIRFLHLTVLSKAYSGVTKAHVHYEITGHTTTTVKLSRTLKYKVDDDTKIEDKEKVKLKDEGSIKTDVEKILGALFAGCMED